MTSPAHTIARVVKFNYRDKAQKIYAEAEMASGLIKSFIVGLDPFILISAEFTETGRQCATKPEDANSIICALYGYGSRNKLIPAYTIRMSNQVIYTMLRQVRLYSSDLSSHSEKIGDAIVGADPLDALIGSSRVLETAAKHWAVRRALLCFSQHLKGNADAIEAIENELNWLMKDALRGNYSPAVRNYENQLKALALQEAVQDLKSAMKERGFS